MSDDRDGVVSAVISASKPDEAAQPVAAASNGPAAPSNALEAIEDIDFLLEEIENKIAPLALA